MKQLAMTNFCLRHPRWVVTAVLLGTIFFTAQFPKVHFDNDPENMLSAEEPVRIFHDRVKEKYDLYDFVIVGIVNTIHEDGIFNVETLGKIDDLTKQLISLHRNEQGQPSVVTPARAGRPAQTVLPNLRPSSAWKRILAKAFRHDPNDLFDKDGKSAIITREIISPSVVDNIKQAEFGQLKIEYLMESPPLTREGALSVRDDSINNPLYRGTLVSEDGKAIALYIPIREKSYSYNVANLVTVLTANWSGNEEIYITGLPVAEDTFGIEMLVQMATSAPLAGLAIFILLYFFFRRLSLVIAPMVIAVISVIWAMGLLIGLGYDVHILSSMIAIFLMPIAVADSVHILSEFYDSYHRFNDKTKTLHHVFGHLFMPMLYTSLTTMAGFASLGLTPIPPVRIFGLHVAFGVGVAWILTITLIPVYIMLWVPERSLQSATIPTIIHRKRTFRLDPFLEWLGVFSYRHNKLILILTLALICLAGYGISRIKVNDNPIRWFTETHRIRVADRVLNEHFGGTYTAYLTLAPAQPEEVLVGEKIEVIRKKARQRFGEIMPNALEQFIALLDGHQNRNLTEFLDDTAEKAGHIDQETTESWNKLADAVNYLDPEGLTPQVLEKTILAVKGAIDADKKQLLDELRQRYWGLEGVPLQNRTLEITDRYIQLSFREFVFEMKANLTAPPFKQPEVLRYVERLQKHLDALPRVGKTSSAVDALKKASYELNYLTPHDNSVGNAERNQSFYSVPDTPSAAAQVFTQLEGMKKKDSLFHLVTRDYQEANIWVQLPSGDNNHMEHVLLDVDTYVTNHPPPGNLKIGWAGLTYINVVWQHKMVIGMLGALASSFIIVLIMMIFLFRSPLFGLLSMIPLSVTIVLIYGIIGLVGKDYDMPLAVLSALTLGLSVDFAIHFLQRAREMFKAKGDWKEAIKDMFKEPARAISRNAIVISVGFTPLLVAPLVPYKTVGFFLATIMAVSWLATLFLLAALVTKFQRKLFMQKQKAEGSSK